MMDDLRDAPEPRPRGWLRKWLGLLPIAKWKRMRELSTYLGHDLTDVFDGLFNRRKKKDVD
jgi:hypothetical protein